MDILLPFILVCLRAVGGEVGATSALAPKIGPLGLVSCISSHCLRDDIKSSGKSAIFSYLKIALRPPPPSIFRCNFFMDADN